MIALKEQYFADIMSNEARLFIQNNTAPFTSVINGTRDIDLVIEHYQSLGFTCELTEPDEDYLIYLIVQ